MMKFYVVVIDCVHKKTRKRLSIRFATAAEDVEQAFDKVCDSYPLGGMEINEWVAVERNDAVYLDSRFVI